MPTGVVGALMANHGIQFVTSRGSVFTHRNTQINVFIELDCFVDFSSSPIESFHVESQDRRGLADIYLFLGVAKTFAPVSRKRCAIELMSTHIADSMTLTCRIDIGSDL